MKRELEQIKGRPVKTNNSLVSVIMSMSCGLNTASLDHQRWVGWPPVIGGGTGALRCLRAQFLNIPHPDHHHLPTSYTQKLHSFDSTHRDDSDEQILSEANQTQDVNTLLELQFLKVMAGSYLLIMFRYIEDFSASISGDATCSGCTLASGTTCNSWFQEDFKTINS